MTSLSDSLFNWCSNLISIEIHDNITILGSNVLRNWASLINFTIPPKIINLPSYILDGCSSLISVDIHDDVETISPNGF